MEIPGTLVSRNLGGSYIYIYIYNTFTNIYIYIYSFSWGFIYGFTSICFSPLKLPGPNFSPARPPAVALPPALPPRAAPRPAVPPPAPPGRARLSDRSPRPAIAVDRRGGPDRETPPGGSPCHTVDGCEIHFAPPKKPGNDNSPVNTRKQWFPMVSKWCRILSIHSIKPPVFFLAWCEKLGSWVFSWL